MKKIVNYLFIILALLIFPKIIYASSLDVKEVILDSKSDEVIILSEPEIDGLDINLGLKFNKVEDFVKYKVVINNKDKIDYLLENDSYNEYLDYKIQNNRVKAKSNNELIITIKLKNKVPETVLESGKINAVLKLKVKDLKGNPINPKTGDNIFLIIGLFIISIVLLTITFLLYKKSNNKKVKCLLIGLVLLPGLVLAAKDLSINININLELSDDVIIHKVGYKVIHKKMNLDGETYDISETEELEGLEGEEVEPTPKEYEGFKSPSSKKITLNKDENISVEYLYIRNKYTFKISDRTYVDNSSTADGNYYYGTQIVLKAKERNGYTFVKWSNDISERETTFELDGKTNIYPVYVEKGDTPYKVIHKQMDLDGENYTVVETEELNGKTNSTIKPPVKNYEGFTSPSVQTKTISENGDTKVVYNYRRNRFNLNITDRTYLSDTSTLNGSYYYDSPIILSAVDREGFEFTKWSNGLTDSTIQFNMESDLEIYPIYTQISKYIISFNSQGGNEVGNIEVDVGTRIAELPTVEKEGYTFVGWYTSVEAGEKIITGFKPKKHMTLYAKWLEENKCIFDGELVQGAEYVNGQYTYRYMQEYGYKDSEYKWLDIDNDGWGVILTDKDSIDPVTTKLCSSINNKPIVSMSNMFFSSKTTSIDTSSFNTSKVENMVTMFNGCSNIENLDISTFNTSNVEEMDAMFNNCSKLESLNLDNLDLTKAGVPSALLLGTTSLKTISMKNWKTPSNFSHVLSRTMAQSYTVETIDVSNWDLSNTTSIEGLFGSSSALKNINGINTWDTSNITNMNGLFQSCPSLESIDLSNFNTSNVNDMTNMFYGCSNIKKIDLSSFDTSNVTYMTAMFSACSKLEELNLDNFDYSKAGVPGGMFANTKSLKTLSMKNSKLPSSFSNGISRIMAQPYTVETIDVSNWDLSNTTSIQGLFGDSKSLKTVKGLNTWDTSNITNIGNLFNGCSSLEKLELSTFDISSVTDMTAMFSGCSKLEELNIDNFDFTKVDSYGSMLSETNSLKTLSMKNCKIKPYFTSVFVGNMAQPKTIETIDVTNWDLSNADNLQGLFQDSSSLKTVIGLDTWDTSNITDISYMFYNCSSLNNINVKNFNTSNIQKMNDIFRKTSIEKIDLSNWDFRKVTGNGNALVSNMFYNNSANDKLKSINLENAKFGNNLDNAFSYMKTVEEINLKNVDTSMATSMFKMFKADENLKAIDIGDLDTSNVKNMYEMFRNCYSLETINIGNIDTSKVTDMSYMFSNLQNLKTIFLGEGFDTSKVTTMRQMFSDDYDLNTIYVKKDFDRSSCEDSDDMFYNNDKLVGAKGTEYEFKVKDGDSYNERDNTYAQISNENHLGYFTYYNEADIIQYRIAYNPNGGNVSYDGFNVNSGEPLGKLTTPSRKGYYFDGWYVSLDNGIKVDENFIPDSDITLFAKWKVSIESMSLPKSLMLIGVNEEKNIVIDNIDEIEEEYSFTSNDTSVVTVDQNGKVTGIKLGKTTITIVGAITGETKTIEVMVGDRHTITYDSNGGEFNNGLTTNIVTTLSQKKYSHTSNVSDTGKKNSNYGNNWTNSSITGTERGDTSKAHVIYMPGFDSITVDAYYNGQGTSYDWLTIWSGNYPNYTAASNYYYGVSGGTKLGGVQSGTYRVNGMNLTKMGHSTFVIYGEYVTFGFKSNDSGYGEGYGYYAIVTGTKIDGTYEEPTKEGLSFGGWYSDQACSDGKEVNIDNVNEDMTVYAKYGYKITYDVNGGNDLNPDTKVIEPGKAIGSLAKPTRTNYYLDGWYTSKDGGVEVDENFVPKGDVTLYARWKKSIENANITNTNIALDYLGEETINIINPNSIEEDYVFISNDSSIASVDSNGKVTANKPGSTTITIRGTMSAKIKTINVTVEYSQINLILDATGGEVNPVNKSAKQGTAIGKLPTPTYDKFHSFKGWYTEFDGGEKVTETSIINENSTLYARWDSKETYTISFDSNGGNDIESFKIEKGKSLEDLKEPFKNHYYFDAWYLGLDSSIKVNTSYVPNSDLTLFAKWIEAPKHTITFEPNGGSVSTETKEIYEDMPIGELPTPEKEDSYFIGWLDETNDKYYDSNSMINNDITLTAQWNETEKVARINDKFYNSIQSAIDNAKSDDEIVVLKNVKENISNNKKITLNLDKHTLTGLVINSKTGNLTLINGRIENDGDKVILNRGKLTIGSENLKINNGANIENISSNSNIATVLYEESNSTTIINSGKIKATENGTQNSSRSNIVSIDYGYTNVKIVINGGTLENKLDENGVGVLSGIYCYSTSSCDITMNGGNIIVSGEDSNNTSVSSYGIYSDNGAHGKITINNGNIKVYSKDLTYAVHIDNGSVIMNNGFIEAKGKDTFGIRSDNNSDKIVINNGHIKVDTIESSYTGPNNYAIQSNGALIINDGLIEGYTNGCTHTIEYGNPIIINGGTIIGNSPASYALFVDTNLIINNGHIIANGINSERSGTNYAIYGYNTTSNITVNGGVLEAKANRDSSNIAYASVIEGQHSPVTVNGGTLNAVSNNTIGYSYAYGISIVGDLILKNTNINIRSNSQSNNSYAYGTSSVDSLKIYDSNINVTSTSGIGQGYTWGLSNVGAIEFYGGKIRTKGSDDEKTNLFYNPPTIVVPDGKQTYEGVGEDGYKEFYLIDSN